MTGAAAPPGAAPVHGAGATQGATVVYRSDARRGAVWHAVFAEEAPEIALVDWSPEAAAEARYLVAWTPPERLAEAMPRLAVLFNTGAGIDHLPLTAIDDGVAIVRMVDPELTRSMVDYVLLAVLAQLRDLPDYLAAQRAGRWAPMPVRRAADHAVGILGLGVLGQAVAAALVGLGFPVRGWSASGRAVPGVQGFAGRQELPAFLAGCRSLVCLLPLTPDTRGILDAGLLAGLPAGAGLVNVGRGGHLVEADLVAALDAGHLASAVLDVLSEEPPPPGHPLFAHPKVIATPHVASMTHPATAARQVIRAVRRHRRGEPLENLVDRGRGY